MNQKIKIVLLSNSIFVFAGSLLVPLYALFVEEIGGGAILAGALYALHFGSNSLVSLFIFKVKDRPYLNEKLLAVNFLIRSICWVLLGIYPSIFVFVLIQLIIGACEAFGSPAFNSLISENLDPKRHISEWGAWELIKSPAITLASLLSGIIVATLGFEILFFLMAGFSFISFLIFTSIRK